MRNNRPILKSFLLLILTVATRLAVPISRNLEKMKLRSLEIDRLSSRSLLDNDFESGFAEPWYDSSPNTAHWVVENYSYPTENYQPPPPSVGTKYLRAVRDSNLTPGLLTLRTVTFVAIPGDEISFNFWIHSKYTGGNTLEVAQLADGVETVFLSLSEFSSPLNANWLVASSPLPVTKPTLMTLIFYAFCGGSAEDAIAVDDIVINSYGDSTTEETSTPTTTTVFTPPTVPCMGELCPTDPTSSSSTSTTTPIMTTVFTPPTAPCVGETCLTSSTTTSTTPDFCPKTVFTPPTAPCVGCPTSTFTSTTTSTAPCISKSQIIGSSIKELERDPLTARSLLNNDFENGVADPWYDTSPFNAHWLIEDFSYPTENYQAPTPTGGTKYLRAIRDSLLTSGQLILRTVTFTAIPGDIISFNFWIRSKYTGGSILELVLSNGGVETTLVELSSYSTSVNFEWRSITLPIPVSEPTDVTLIFLAYIGGYPEDAIAIDDIVATPTTTPTTTNPKQCGGIYNTASGNFSSPNYPSPYGFDDNCLYQISISTGNSIKLTFIYFNTESGSDFVTVYDGPTAASPVLLRASGYNTNPSVTTTGRDCLVLHMSDSKNSLAGWTANYVSL